ANALAIWRVHGFDEILREAWQQGILLGGWSAGMICWFEQGVTDSFGPELGPDGLPGLSARQRVPALRRGGTSAPGVHAARRGWVPERRRRGRRRRPAFRRHGAARGRYVARGRDGLPRHA